MQDDALVELVRQRSDIVAVISDYVALKKRGKDYLGLCPFHGEKTASFHVSPDKGLFYCFGCQVGGNVFNFIQLRENVGFGEALRILAERAGISLEREESPTARRGRREREEATRVLEMAAGHFRGQLAGPTGQAAREYLAGRSLRPETIERFELGFAPESWDNLLRALVRQGSEPQLLARLGLVSQRSDGRPGFYDRFRGRVMFPIRDLRGRVIGFGGRALKDGQEPKYLNSPESSVFDKGKNLYALHLARDAIRRREQAVIVEGYMDAIAAHQAGIDNVVASMGTALTAAQGELLRQQAEQVIIAYDADSAGQAATLRGLDLVAGLGCQVRVLRLEEGKDPDEFIRARGADAFRAAVEGAEGLVSFKLRLARGRHSSGTPEGKAAIAKAVIPVIAHADPVERAEHLRRLTSELDTTPEALTNEVKRYLRDSRPPAGTPSASRTGSQGDIGGKSWHNTGEKSGAPARKPSDAVFLKAQRDLLATILRDPQLVEAVREKIPPDLYSEPDLGRLARVLYSQPGPAGVPADLPAELQSLAAALVLGAGPSGAQGARLVNDCIKVITEHKMVQRMGEIRRSIAAAEERGEAVDPPLIKEYQELARKAKALSPGDTPRR